MDTVSLDSYKWAEIKGVGSDLKVLHHFAKHYSKNYLLPVLIPIEQTLEFYYQNFFPLATFCF
jgi:hypothetical protein